MFDVIGCIRWLSDIKEVKSKKDAKSNFLTLWKSSFENIEKEQLYQFTDYLRCVISIDEKDLVLPEEIIAEFFNQDIKDISAHVEKFKEQLLYLENIDYTYNTKNVIVEMKRH
jgi:hypothetical protein